MNDQPPVPTFAGIKFVLALTMAIAWTVLPVTGGIQAGPVGFFGGLFAALIIHGICAGIWGIFEIQLLHHVHQVAALKEATDQTAILRNIHTELLRQNEPQRPPPKPVPEKTPFEIAQAEEMQRREQAEIEARAEAERKRRYSTPTMSEYQAQQIAEADALRFKGR